MLTNDIIYDIILSIKGGAMMIVKIELRKQPEKYLNKTDAKTYTKIKNALEGLKRLDGDIKHLAGSKGMYRLKIPPYRILFTQAWSVENGEDVLTLTIERIGPRGDVYKKGR